MSAVPSSSANPTNPPDTFADIDAVDVDWLLGTSF